MTNDVRNEVTDLLQHLIRNACVNDGTVESGHESRSVDVLAQYLGDAGLDLERYEPKPGRGNLVARIEGSDPTAPTLLLMGHTDVVPVTPESWRRDPFGGELVDGEVWGRGAVDMLNLTASMAVAFKGLAQSGFKPKGTLVYLAVADEESLGTWGAEHLVNEQRDAVAADYVITESGGFQMPAPSGPKLPVLVGEKGSYWCRITVKGTPGHASQPFRTDNALVTAAEVVRRLADYRPPAQIHNIWRDFIGPHRRVLRDPADRPRARGARVHAHDVRADDHPRRHEDERDPRRGRDRGRHPHAARSEGRRRAPHDRDRARRPRGERRHHAVRRQRVDRVAEQHAVVGDAPARQ
jgi:acetylornithine deacetylase/succinyl-diaminopimelate desuccinylase-like protein